MKECSHCREYDIPDDKELDERLSAIETELHNGMIPSALPAEIGDQIRETARHGAMYQVQTVNLMGGLCIMVEYRLSPDGIMQLEFRDSHNCPFWRGTFRPAVAE